MYHVTYLFTVYHQGKRMTEFVVLHVDRKNGCIVITEQEAETSIINCTTAVETIEIIDQTVSQNRMSTLKLSQKAFNELSKIRTIKTF